MHLEHGGMRIIHLRNSGMMYGFELKELKIAAHLTVYRENSDRLETGFQLYVREERE